MGNQEPAADRKKRKKPKKFYGKTAKVGAIWSVIRQLGKYVFAVPTSMIMARLLSPHEFGIAAAASFFITMASRVTELGLNAALVRVKNLRPEHTASVFVTAVALGGLAWLVLTAASPFVGGFFRSPEVAQVLPVSAVAFLIAPLMTVPSTLLERQMRFKAISIADWADGLTGMVVSVGLAAAGFSYWSMIYSQLASTAANVATTCYLARWRPSLRFSWPALRELLSFGLGIQLKRFLEFGAGNLDNLLIGRFISITALGLYDKAFMTAQRLQRMLNLGPSISFRIFAVIQDDNARFRRAYQRVLLMLALIAFPPLVLCIVVAPQLFVVMYGPRWSSCVPAFQFLCLATIIRLMSAHATRANEAKGMIWRQVLQTSAYVAMIALGVWIGSRWGIGGAACGVLIARATLAVFVQRLLKEAMDGRWRDMLSPLIPGLFVSSTIAAIALGIEALMRVWFPAVPAVVLLGTQSVAAALAYAPLVLFCPFSSAREVVRETILDFAPQFASWVPAPASEVSLSEVS